jgi:hypothetical protein
MTKIPQARIEPSISISSLLTLQPSYNEKNILLKRIKSNIFSDEYLSLKLKRIYCKRKYRHLTDFS